MKKKKYITIFLHILFWILVITISYLALSQRVKMFRIGGKTQIIMIRDIFVLYVILMGVPWMAIMGYSNIFWWIPKYLKPPNIIKYVLVISIVFSITLLIEIGISIVVIEHQAKQVLAGNYSLLWAEITLHIIIFIISFSYKLFLDQASDQKIKQRLREEKLATELGFLKAQINPHFLFNTLNNLFSMARKFEDQSVANSIAKLSHLMRYMLYETNVAYISLDKEIDYIQNYIQLQKLRIAEDDDIHINFEIKGETHLKSVPPMLLIPFVENAFKHGISLENKSKIDIYLSVNKDSWSFRVENTVNILSKNNKSDDAHIGLENVKKRLLLLYPNKHTIDIQEVNGVFIAQMHLNT